MRTREQEHGAPALVRSLVEILATSADAADVGVERFERLFGFLLPQVGEHLFGCSRHLAHRANATVCYDAVPGLPPVLLVRIDPSGDDAVPPVTPTLVGVVDRLAAFGFSSRAWTGEYGRRMGVTAARGRLTVAISSSQHPDAGPGSEVVANVRATWTTPR